MPKLEPFRPYNRVYLGQVKWKCFVWKYYVREVILKKIADETMLRAGEYGEIRW